MAQASSNKYSVAWFKLAEFVTRREKERALGIYKLLALSIEDEAFAHQLAGDLLLSFNDSQALTRYALAAHHYCLNGRFSQAAAVHEHLFTLQPSEFQHLHALLALYHQHSVHQLNINLGKRLLAVALHNNNLPQANSITEILSTYMKPIDIAQLREHSAMHMIQQTCLIHETLVKDMLTQIVHTYIQEGTHHLNRFMHTLHALNTPYAQEMHHYIETLLS